MNLLAGMDMRFVAIAVVVSAVFGFVAAHFLFSLWWSVVFWGIGGASLGHFAKDYKEIVQVGAVYGFFLTMSFLFFSFGASFDKFFSLVLLTLALSIIGMFGGVISSAVGWFLKPYLVLEPMRKYF
jgi:hypothetical protein